MTRKIAVCLSGQPRTWKKCYSTWLDVMSDWGEVDYFCHLWDYNSDSSLSQYELGATPDTVITNEEKNEIIEALHPKKLVFQAKKDNVELHGEGVTNVIAPWAHSQFYSMWRVANLKRQYEIENNFEYDLVVRLRTDLVLQPKFVPPVPGPSTLYTIHTVDSDPTYGVPRIGDIFFLSDSLTFDHVAMFYHSLKYIDADHVVPGKPDLYAFPPEIGLYYYCVMMGIRIHPLSNGLDIKVMRSQEHLARVGKLEPYETA